MFVAYANLTCSSPGVPEALTLLSSDKDVPDQYSIKMCLNEGI